MSSVNWVFLWLVKFGVLDSWTKLKRFATEVGEMVTPYCLQPPILLYLIPGVLTVGSPTEQTQPVRSESVRPTVVLNKRPVCFKSSSVKGNNPVYLPVGQEAAQGIDWLNMQ